MDWAVLTAEPDAGNENDASLQMLATAHTPGGTYRVRLTGDMEEEATGALLRQGVFPPAVDVLKVSHHGARNGGNDLVRAVAPALSVVQVGRENGYGHPHPSIIAELQRHGPGLVPAGVDVHHLPFVETVASDGVRTVSIA